MAINLPIQTISVFFISVFFLLSISIQCNVRDDYYLLPFKFAAATKEGTMNVPANETTGVLSGFLSYKSPNLGITLMYPADWIPSTSGLVDYTDLIAFYAPLENLTDTFPPRLKLSVVTYNHNISLSEYTNFVSMILNQSKSFEIKNSSDYAISGIPSHKVVIAEKPLQNGTLQIKNMNIWTIVGNRVYLITYDGEEAKFNRHMPEVEKILKSIHINN
jgi:serine/threonine-protein kinase